MTTTTSTNTNSNTNAGSESGRTSDDDAVLGILKAIPYGVYAVLEPADHEASPEELSERLRTELHAVARSLGQHLRYALTVYEDADLHESRAHVMVEPIAGAFDRPGLLAMAAHMVPHLPDGWMALHVLAPGIVGDVDRRLESHRDLVPASLEIACPASVVGCTGQCSGSPRKPEFADPLHLLRSYAQVKFVGVLRDGVFTRCAPRPRRR